MKRKVLGLKPTGKKIFRGESSRIPEQDQTPKTREEVLSTLYIRYGCPERLKITIKSTGETVILESGKIVSSNTETPSLEVPITPARSPRIEDNIKPVPQVQFTDNVINFPVKKKRGRPRKIQPNTVQEAKEMLDLLAKEYMR